MASTRELLEARAYERNRLLGALHGKGPLAEEPAGWGALPLGVSVVLALLVVGGAAGAARVAPRLPVGWDRGAIVVARESGARYVAIDAVLHPVVNTTSARLALPSSATASILVVDDTVLDSVPHGAALGIVGAPDELSSPAALAQSGWSACLREGVATVALRGAPAEPPAAPGVALAAGPGVALAAGPGVALAAAPGFAATHPDGTSLVVAGHRYLIPPEYQANTLRALGLDRRRVGDVPIPWLDVFPAGADLRVRFPDRLGATLPAGAAAGPATRIGQLIRNASTGNSPAVLTAQGLVAVTEFVAALYAAAAPGRLGQPVVVTSVDLAAVPPAPDVLIGDPSWPAELPTPVDPLQTCAVLDSPADAVPASRLVRADQVRPTRAVPGASLALVTATGASGSSRYLVDGEGRRFEVPAGSGEVLARLGYAEVVPRPVPPAWLALLTPGPVLSQSAALRPVGPTAATSQAPDIDDGPGRGMVEG